VSDAKASAEEVKLCPPATTLNSTTHEVGMEKGGETYEGSCHLELTVDRRKEAHGHAAAQ
jgi:hypothetical protein